MGCPAITVEAVGETALGMLYAVESHCCRTKREAGAEKIHKDDARSGGLE